MRLLRTRGWHGRVGPQSTGSWVFAAAMVAAVGMTIAGCNEDEPPAAPPEPPERPPKPQEETKAEAESEDAGRMFGDEGQLLASDRSVLGVRLPRGAELVHEEERMHRFQVEAPVPRVLAYFGPRLVTGRVDKVGDGAVYENAVARRVKVSTIKMNVRIVPNAGGTQVEIVELRSPSKQPPSPEDRLDKMPNRRFVD